MPTSFCFPFYVCLSVCACNADPEMDDVDADVMECLEEGFTGFIDPENVDDFEDDFILQVYACCLFGALGMWKLLKHS